MYYVYTHQTCDVKRFDDNITQDCDMPLYFDENAIKIPLG